MVQVLTIVYELMLYVLFETLCIVRLVRLSDMLLVASQWPFSLVPLLGLEPMQAQSKQQVLTPQPRWPPQPPSANRQNGIVSSNLDRERSYSQNAGSVKSVDHQPNYAEHNRGYVPEVINQCTLMKPREYRVQAV